jgi:ribosomal protein S18 acetylase RimI-like enzyme
MSEQRFYIKPLKSEDLDSIVSIHLTAFPDSALSMLGRSVVERYYKWRLRNTLQTIRIGAYIDQSLVGYCIGGAQEESLVDFVRENKNFLVWQVLLHPQVFLSSTVFWRARPMLRRFLSLLGVFRERKKKEVSNDPLSVCILVIAVHSSFQGMGVGKALMAEAENMSHCLGARRMYLTVRPDNHRAIAFYERLGWVKAVQEGFWDGRMYKIL